MSTKLQRLEQQIEAGLKTFLPMCRALKEINDEELWKDGYESFNAYCRERWAMDTFQACRMIRAATVVADLEEAGCETLPANDGQCRVLGRMNPEQRVQLWKKVCRKKSVKPTAKIIEAEAKEMGFIEAPKGAVVEEPEEPTVAVDLGRVLNSLKVLNGRIQASDAEAVKKLVVEVGETFFSMCRKIGLLDENNNPIKPAEEQQAEPVAVEPEPVATIPMTPRKDVGVPQPWSDNDE